MKMTSFIKTALLLLAVALSLPVHAANVVVEFIHTDAQGTPIAVTDKYGSVIERYEYEPYGLQTSGPVADGPGYTGHVEDTATGLVYMQQRYYDPGIGGFLSIDPVTAYSNPVGQFNRYRYANNNPYKYIDPDGEDVAAFFRVAQSGNATMYANALNATAIARSNPVNDPSYQAYQCGASHGCRQTALNAGAAAANTGAVIALAAGQVEVAVPLAVAGKVLSGAAYLDKLASGTATGEDHALIVADVAVGAGLGTVEKTFGAAGKEFIIATDQVSDAIQSTKSVIEDIENKAKE